MSDQLTLFKPTQLSVITRLGIIDSNGRSTSNQCGKEGVGAYEYELVVLFSEKTALDRNGFIIDHQDLDDTVKAVTVESCERMSVQIVEDISKLLGKRKIPFIGMKIKIRPMKRVENNSAYFRHYYAANKEDMLLLLNF